MTFIKERTKVVWEEKLPKVNFCSAKLFPEVVVADQPCRGGGGQLSKSFFTKFCLSNWFHPDQNWLHRPRPHDKSLDRPHVRHQYRTYDWSHDWPPKLWCQCSLESETGCGDFFAKVCWWWSLPIFLLSHFSETESQQRANPVSQPKVTIFKKKNSSKNAAIFVWEGFFLYFIFSPHNGQLKVNCPNLKWTSWPGFNQM